MPSVQTHGRTPPQTPSAGCLPSLQGRGPLEQVQRLVAQIPDTEGGESHDHRPAELDPFSLDESRHREDLMDSIKVMNGLSGW